MTIIKDTLDIQKLHNNAEEIENIAKIIIKNNAVKLHLACGTNYFENWINIDNNSDNNISKLDLNYDLRNPLPFKDNSVDFIFNEHFLEHLTAEEGHRALKDFMRVLKPNGIMRIAMPDLMNIVNAYLHDDWEDTKINFLDKHGLGFIKTKAELLNINFRAWGHKWLYDWEELERRLNEVNAKNIKKCLWQQSEHAVLKNLETRNESTLIAEIIK